ncbi:HAD family hydrolase [Bifidobacterium choloepi]|uniref:HAD family hydrolase n=1 Tax=Bifidobacterium choloepi TaxID=2614131 RepID=A0A6I5NKD9_9BIFI|nr:HAD family hydrolase [Bifidobacterium choloepi]NEG69312.1 HAD family hydrolase [Bifidobacterium choloepi]
MEAVVVPNWTDVDLDAVSGAMRMVAFDLDGTLARSKKPMKEPMAAALSELTGHVPVAIVSGGTMALVTSQVTDMLTAEANRDNIYLMPTSGTRYYRWKAAASPTPASDHPSEGEGSGRPAGEWELQYKHDLSEIDRKLVMKSLERHAREMGLWEEHPYGDVIEDRGSQITFSALGQQAPVELKEQWDPTNEKKNRLKVAVQRDVPHLEVRSGGSTSVDVSLRGVDKAYAVNELAGMLGVGIGDIVFIGDRMDPDGNDYPAARAGTRALRVDGPEDTLAVVSHMNDWFRHHR